MSRNDNLWHGQTLEVIGLTGEYESGKTLFGVSIDPKNTLVIDAEKSASSYQASMGFDRIDLINEARTDHGDNYTPLQLFATFMRVINEASDEYSVWLIDPVTDIESGMVMYVTENPEQFGYTSAQFKRMSSLKWGPLKELYKRILAVAAEKCDTLVFTAHLKVKWKGDRPTKDKEPRGKSTLMELAAMYLWMDRPTDDKGRKQVIPSARVLKSRLVSIDHDDNDELIMVPTLPPRLPVATPAAIRAYVLNPPDPMKLKKGEREAAEAGMSDDERLELQAEMLENQRAIAESDKPADDGFFVGTPEPETKPEAKATAPAPFLSPEDLEQEAAKPSNGEELGACSDEAEVEGGHCTPAQLRDLLDLKAALGMPDDIWVGDILSKRGVALPVELLYDQATDLINVMKLAALEK